MSKFYLINSLIIPLPEEDKMATFIVTRISQKRAKQLLHEALDRGEVFSAIGHKATAQALSILLGVEVPVNRKRIFFEPNDRAIAFVLKTRLPEGLVIKSVEELEQIGFELYEIYRQK